MNFFRRYDSIHVFLTLSRWSYTTWCDHHRTGREFCGPWDCFHFLSVFLQKRSWKIWRIVANLPRETLGKKETIDFSRFCRVGSPRLKYRAGGIHYGNREPTVTWIEENSVVLTDEREGRCFRKENGKIRRCLIFQSIILRSTEYHSRRAIAAIVFLSILLSATSIDRVTNCIKCFKIWTII